MKNIKILARRMALEAKLKKIEVQQGKLGKSLDKLTESCGHEIIVVMNVEGVWRDCRLGYCLFCQDVNPWERKHIPQDLLKKMENSTIIYADQYSLVLPKTPTKKLKKLEKLYKELKKEFPDTSESQIAEKMK